MSASQRAVRGLLRLRRHGVVEQPAAGAVAETTIHLQRAAAAQAGPSVAAFRSALRLSCTRVTEYQARRCVHLHVVLRADRVDADDNDAVLPSPGWATVELPAGAMRTAVSVVRAPLPRVPGTSLREACGGAA